MSMTHCSLWLERSRCGERRGLQMGFQITTPTFVRHQDNHKVQDEWLYHDVSHLESTPDLEHYSQERVDELCSISWTLAYNP